MGSQLTKKLIAGLTANGLITPQFVERGMNGQAFATYIRTQLAPVLEARTVVICDDLSVHKNSEAAAALHERGCSFLFLPPHSPDLNPIEMAFA